MLFEGDDLIEILTVSNFVYKVYSNKKIGYSTDIGERREFWKISEIYNDLGLSKEFDKANYGKGLCNWINRSGTRKPLF